MKKNCLYCYENLSAEEVDFHAVCSKKFFGQYPPPELGYTENELADLALKLIKAHSTVTGVQPKLSLHITSTAAEPQVKKFTIVGLWGMYILKPPTENYPHLPEVEDLTMQMAAAAKMKVVPHSLIRLQSGSLAYITKRVDRVKKNKLHMEDMCQLTDRLTENKYYGSYEQIGKAIWKYSDNPGLDLVNFFELLIFCFLTGNADMHLKNFSLLQQPAGGMALAPAYDLVNTALVNPADKDEMALTLNGKKRKIQKQDFTKAMSALKLNDIQQVNIFNKLTSCLPIWENLIKISFLTPAYKKNYKKILHERVQVLL